MQKITLRPHNSSEVSSPLGVIWEWVRGVLLDRSRRRPSLYCFIRSSAASAPTPDNAVHRTAEQWIGQQSQERRHGQRLAWINSVEDDNFVDQIDDDRDNEDPG